MRDEKDVRSTVGAIQNKSPFSERKQRAKLTGPSSEMRDLSTALLLAAMLALAAPRAAPRGGGLLATFRRQLEREKLAGLKDGHRAEFSKNEVSTSLLNHRVYQKDTKSGSYVLEYYKVPGSGYGVTYNYHSFPQGDQNQKYSYSYSEFSAPYTYSGRKQHGLGAGLRGYRDIFGYPHANSKSNSYFTFSPRFFDFDNFDRIFSKDWNMVDIMRDPIFEANYIPDYF